MKRTIAILFCMAIAITASASESFTLNIPQRFNANQETGEVRILLTLSAAPAGAQLVVGGTATLNLGDTQTVAGDSVKFEAASGNDVRITYRPLSNFSGDFCLGANAVEKNIAMRFVGAQDVTDYHISTYVVASPDNECSQPSKHAGDSAATLIPVDDGVAPALQATDRNRLPFDVVLVLDKSGSMAEFPPEAAAPPTKAEILHSAAEAFVAQWDQIDAGDNWSHDRIGLVFFDNAVTPRTFPAGDPPANFFVQRSVGWQPIINDIGTLTPGGSTSIGGGINEAMQQWKNDPANDLSVVVVTDGKQNTAPLITPTASGHLGLLPVSGLDQELRKRFIPIQTIAFGVPAAVDQDLLRNISVETSGISFIAIDVSTVYDTFAQTLLAILKGFTASLALRRNDTMTGKGPSASLPVVVDASAERVVFSLQWAPPLVNALDLEVFRPGSSNIEVPSSAEKTKQAALQSFDIHPGDVGTWSVRVKRNPAALHEASLTIPYTLNVFFRERHLDFRISFDTSRVGTGDTIGVRAVVAYDGKPLAGLPANAIRVRIQRPNEGLGNILHSAQFADNSTGNTTTPSGDVKTPYQRKLDALTNAALIDRVLPRDVDTITLQDQGRGVYASTFNQTSTPGVYGFETLLDWTDARTGHVRREERVELNVKVKPDATMSEIHATRASDGTSLIRVTPRDKFGNYLGPGYASVVKATLRSAGVLTAGDPVDRDQTGTYVFTVTGLPTGDTPAVDVIVDGVNIGSSSPSSTSSSSGAYRFFIDLGPNFPHGKWSLNAGVERPVTNDWSLEGILGYHRFDASNPHIWQLAVGGKRYFGTSPWRPFVDAAVGAYRFDPGNSTKAGANVGAGVLYEWSGKCGVEGVWNYHATSHTRFSTVQVGVRF